jgi:hypothetical protein
VSHFGLIFHVTSIFRVHCWVVFQHIVFVDGFLFPVKELGLLTNPGHWVIGFWTPVAPICILYCKQCITMNGYGICWFSRFGFPGEKSLCNVCICHGIFSVLLLRICLQ